MSGLGRVVGTVLSPVAAALGVFGKGKAAPRTALPLPVATPRANSVVADALAARRGSAANQRSGALGAESTTKKTLLGQ